MSELQGKVAMVTGAARPRGMGEATVRRLLKAGATVIATDVLDSEGRRLAADTGATYVHLNVSSESEWNKTIGGIEADHGRLDVLVNNAAI